MISEVSNQAGAADKRPFQHGPILTHPSAGDNQKLESSLLEGSGNLMTVPWVSPIRSEEMTLKMKWPCFTLYGKVKHVYFCGGLEWHP